MSEQPPWMRDGWMRQFLRAEAGPQVEMLRAIRQRVERDLAANPEGLPSKACVRAAKLYLSGYKLVAGLELAHAKLQLEAERVARGMPPMSDDEYRAANLEIARAGLPELPDAELDAEVERRRRARPLVIAAGSEEP